MINMAAPGTLLFHRGQEGDESDNDMWDDTALIKAYDNAVSVVKAELQDHLGVDTEQKSQDIKKKKSNKRKKKKNKKKRQWKIGDQCRATFKEDGLVYDAEVISLNEEAGTCCIRYRGYRNEEEQKISDLQPSSGRLPRQMTNTTASDLDIGSFADSMEWSGEKPRAQKNKKSNQHGPSQSASQSSFAWPGMPPYSFPSMPSQTTFAHPSMPMFNGFPSPFHHQSNIPFMPPPPPPVQEDMADTDNEALCSMLMAWYMSGYHTGYYQGLKHSRQHTLSGAGLHPDPYR